MIDKLLVIRFKQFYRTLIGIGLIRTLFLIGLVGFIAFALFMETSKEPDALYVAGLTVLLVMAIHAKREDKAFFIIHFNHYRIIWFFEYLLLSSPVIAFLIFHLQGIPLLLLLAALILIIQWKSNTKKHSLNSWIQRLIPSDCFEWKAGVRQTLFALIALWIVGMGTSFFIGSVPVVIFILGIIPFSFYEKGEPYQMMMAYEMGSVQFLYHKIKMQISLFSVLSIPLIAAFLVFHSASWYIPVTEYFIFVFLYIYLILTKYAFYEPNRKSAPAQLFGAIGAIGGIIPIFLPLVWLLSIRFFFKAKENLNIYLDDYN